MDTNTTAEAEGETISGVRVDVVAKARALCLASCRAAMCVDGGKCLCSWPGNGGSWFWTYIEQAKTTPAKATAASG